VKVLISAFACEPNKGSKPEVAFRALWVLTLPAPIPAMRPFGDDPEKPCLERIREVPDRAHTSFEQEILDA
jgi:hypothetical protein